MFVCIHDILNEYQGPIKRFCDLVKLLVHKHLVQDKIGLCIRKASATFVKVKEISLQVREALAATVKVK